MPCRSLTRGSRSCRYQPGREQGCNDGEGTVSQAARCGTWVYYTRNHAYATPWGLSGWIDNTRATGCLSGTFSYDQYFWPGQYF